MPLSRSLAAALLAPAFASAQDTARDTARVAPVVVTATRSPLAAGRAPSSVSVLAGDALRRQGIVTVAEALRQVPGLSLVQVGSTGGATSLFIRGGESKFTKVLIDGVPVNDAGGAFDFSSLTTDNLDRIEIVRGPASVLYGSDAVAGVVQLFTRPGTGRSRAELSGRGGGYGTVDLDAAVRGSAGPYAYSVGGARHSTRGHQAFNSGFRNDVASALVAASAGRGDVRASVRLTDVALHYPTNGSGQVVDSNARRGEGRLAVGLDAGYRLGRAAEVRLALASHDAHGVTTDTPDSRGDTAGYYFSTGDRSRRRSGDLRLDLALPGSTRLTVGGQVERQWQASATTSNFGDNQFTAVRRTTGVYGQLLLASAAGYTVTAGSRFEHNERFGDFVTYRAAGAAPLGARTRLRASIGTAFREPTFLENFGGAFVIGNPDLEPERSLGIDVGVEHRVSEAATVSATYFSNSFRDLIDYAFSETEPNFFNVARTRSAGVELEARATLPLGFHGDLAATYLETRVVEPGSSPSATATFAPGARLLRRPMHTVSAGFGYRDQRGAVDLRASRVGAREDNYFAPDFTVRRVALAPYTRADVSAEVALLPAARARGAAWVTLRVENAFDARYTDAAGFNFDFALTDEASLRQTGYRAAGRRALVGLRVSY